MDMCAEHTAENAAEEAKRDMCPAVGRRATSNAAKKMHPKVECSTACLIP